MKGQLFSVDLVVALSIFLGIIMLAAYFLMAIPDTTIQDMQMKANSIASSLAANGIGIEGIVDCDKLAKLANMSYEDLKAQYGVNPYELWIELPNITADDCPAMRRKVDVMLVLDNSGSMAGVKMSDAKKAAKAFVAMMNESWDQAGMLGYNTTANVTYTGYLLAVTDTANKTGLNASIDRLVARGSTAIGDAILNATNEITSMRGRNAASKVEVLLTDGNANIFPGGGLNQEDWYSPQPCHYSPTLGVYDYCPKSFKYALDQADVARQKGIVIYTITLGNDANKTFMTQIATKTGGIMYFAPNSTYLQTIFETIAKRVTAMSSYGQIADVTSTEVTSVVRIVQLGGRSYNLIIHVYRK